ncbi:proteasome assembly chaperone family protein [Candidatus Woesearchaeota archaeon]|nr:proteasome assembly chaperone family protein [Candidatus Woesearchaeota archaeon]
MNINLTKKPMGCTIIEGFPGFGLIGTITTEFLLDTLKAEQIGTIQDDTIPTMVAIHEGKVVHPIGVFYDKKTNLLIIHIIASLKGIEWKLADAIVDLAKKLKAKEIVSLEGVASQSQDAPRCFYYSSIAANTPKFKKSGIEPLKEGIIIGVTGALLVADGVPVTAVFAETHSGLPDSKAAADIIKVLDSYLGLKLDPKPLLEQAEKFEDKIKTLMSKGKETTEEEQKKRMSYVG